MLYMHSRDPTATLAPLNQVTSTHLLKTSKTVSIREEAMINICIKEATATTSRALTPAQHPSAPKPAYNPKQLAKLVTIINEKG